MALKKSQLYSSLWQSCDELRAQDIHKNVDVFNRQVEMPRYSRRVPVAEIASSANDYNLNIPHYIDSSEPEDLHDLDAHLNGGIPNRDIEALDAYWTVFPTLRAALFEDSGREGYSEARVQTQQVKATIFGHAAFNMASPFLHSKGCLYYAIRHSAGFKGVAPRNVPPLRPAGSTSRRLAQAAGLQR